MCDIDSDVDNTVVFQTSMSVSQIMVAVNKFVPTQMDHLSVHVVQALIYHLTVSIVMVRD